MTWKSTEIIFGMYKKYWKKNPLQGAHTLSTRARENEIIETDNIDKSDDEDSPPRYELPVVLEGYVMDEETARDFFACNDREDLQRIVS